MARVGNEGTTGTPGNATGTDLGTTIQTAEIDDDAVTYAKIQNISATARLLGRNTAGAGDTEEVTPTQATAMLDAATATVKGLVPTPPNNTTTFLRGDATFAAPATVAHASSHETGGADLLGDLTLATILKVNANIQFPATQVANAGANVLDDYEEGTWTPGLTFGGASVDMTFANQVGRYTKIGRAVIINGILTLSAKGSSTGAARVTGLPFANNASLPFQCALLCDTITFAGEITANCPVSVSTIDLWECPETGTVVQLDDPNFAATSSVRLTGHYTV